MGRTYVVGEVVRDRRRRRYMLPEGEIVVQGPYQVIEVTLDDGRVAHAVVADVEVGLVGTGLLLRALAPPADRPLRRALANAFQLPAPAAAPPAAAPPAAAPPAAATVLAPIAPAGWGWKLVQELRHGPEDVPMDDLSGVLTPHIDFVGQVPEHARVAAALARSHYDQGRVQQLVRAPRGQRYVLSPVYQQPVLEPPATRLRRRAQSLIAGDFFDEGVNGLAVDTDGTATDLRTGRRGRMDPRDAP